MRIMWARIYHKYTHLRRGFRRFCEPNSDQTRAVQYRFKAPLYSMRGQALAYTCRHDPWYPAWSIEILQKIFESLAKLAKFRN